MFKPAFLLSVALLSIFPAAFAAVPTEKQVSMRVEALLKQMTLEEKVGQLNQVGGIAFIPGSPKPEDVVRSGQAGSILWLNDAVSINKLQKIAVEQSRLKIPLIFGLDVIHGFKTIFPMPLALASSWDASLVERVQTSAAREARAAGISWTFAPMVDIARDPRWGRIVEGAGEDPFLGSVIAQAQVRGFQGADLSSPDRVMACAKHFAGYGAADGGRDYDSSYIPESQMWNVYLPPFKAAADAGVATFMAAYMDLNEVPATGNRFLLQDVLRKAWGFKGFVVSDANSVGDLVTHHFARDAHDAAYRAFTAGCDMDMASSTYYRNLAALVKSGKVPMAAIDNSVRAVLAAKVRLGLFEHPYADENLLAKVSTDPSQKALAREAAARTMVLLRNEGSLLPLNRTATRSVAVIGPLADAQRDMLSMWAGFSVDTSKVVTIVQGLRNKLGGAARVEYAQGVQIAKKFPSMFESMFGGKPEAPWTDEQSKAEFQKALDLARASDVVVMAIGETAFMSGESATQSDLELPGRQQELMEAVVALGKPVVLVLVSGRPLNITWASTHVPAILEAWHPGEEGGNALADLLYGDAQPSARMPVTWPRNSGQIPAYYAHTRTHAPEDAKEFTSRYWDQSSAPLYPFGHGLSYTTFAVSDLKLKDARVKRGGTVEVTVNVANTGKRSGDEVVQLYLHQQAGTSSRPVRQMKGFERVSLAPGESRVVTFRIGPAERTYWSAAERKWVEDTEAFDVWAGFNAQATLHGTFEIIP